ncbi:MAG: hypothetical protein PHS59_18150 [Paludibacter sp.]|nr:hypothetical protein [Paludibacter sp.]
MLTNDEIIEVDEYIQNVLSPKFGEYDEIDDFIVVCSCDEGIFWEFKSLSDFYIKKLEATIESEFQKHHGVTLSMIAAQERLCQLRILSNKFKDISDTKDIAMLCIASSVDLYFLEAQKKQYEKEGSNSFKL